MIRKLSQANLTLLSRGIFYLALTIIWSLVSLKINSIESQSGYFEIRPLLQFKAILPAAIFGGRYLLFGRYRLGPSNPWIFPLSLFLAGGSVFDKLLSAANIGYVLMIAADMLIWAFLINETAETLRTVFRFWKSLPKVNYAMFIDIWAKLNNDLFKLSLWLTSLVGLTFFYLVSFFMVDALLYSYLLLTPLVATGASLYLLMYSKIKAWVNNDLTLIDAELAVQLDWDQVKGDPELPQRVAWFQYLSLIRNYLKDLEKPALLIRLFLLYLACSGLILCLPYFFGRVIEV